jgi:surface protein
MTDLFNNLDDSKQRDQFNGNISYWDVSNVNKMEGMFYRCTSFNKDISLWDTHNVKTM